MLLMPRSSGIWFPRPWGNAKLEHWHHVSFLRASGIANMVNISKAGAFEPEKLEALIHLIEEDLGYILHGAVQKVKCDLSNDTEALFRFFDGVIEIEATVTRTDFEDWIADELEKIERCVKTLKCAT
jgi:hypothetical chaperone protein